MTRSFYGVVIGRGREPIDSHDGSLTAGPSPCAPIAGAGSRPARPTQLEAILRAWASSPHGRR